MGGGFRRGRRKKGGRHDIKTAAKAKDDPTNPSNPSEKTTTASEKGKAPPNPSSLLKIKSFNQP